MITDKDDEKISKTIEQINNAVFRATKFIDELMDIARTPALNIGSVDVNKLLQDVAKELCISSNIRVDWNIADSLPNIPADPEKLREVITNLLKNAMEAMEQDGVLGIKTEIEKKFVKITMDDTGNGMAEDEMVKMWTPFYTSKRMGKGLGMAVVKRLIEAHKGKIDVESEIGVGTRVGVRLPIG